MVADFFKKVKIVLSDAFSSFRANNDLSAASSLAFSATLALIPSIFLLTVVLGAAIGSSVRAMARTRELLTPLIPAYSQDILREVQFISSNAGAIGFLNALVLLWSVTPLVADMRESLGTVFRKKRTRPFLLEKLFDVALSIVFLIGLSTIAISGIAFSLTEKWSHLHLALGYLEGAAPFFFITAAVFSLYAVFSGQVRMLHLLTGALATSLLWFAMRPAFHLFLMYNPGYGFAFGSFKSLFVVIIWIYCSLVVFLLGAELAASFGRNEAVFIRKQRECGKDIPAPVGSKYILCFEKGGVIFREGDPGNEMYSVLKGSVAFHKGDREPGVVAEGKCFGGASFFLSSPRAGTAVALEDVEVAAINNENINDLMREHPQFVGEIMRDMARRLQEKNELLD